MTALWICFSVFVTHRRRIYRTAVCTSPGITTRTRRRWRTRRRTPILLRRRRPSRRTQTGSVRGLWTERRGSTPSHAPPSLWPSSSSTSSTGSPTRSSDTRAPAEPDTAFQQLTSFIWTLSYERRFYTSVFMNGVVTLLLFLITAAQNTILRIYEDESHWTHRCPGYISHKSIELLHSKYNVI